MKRNNRQLLNENVESVAQSIQIEHSNIFIFWQGLFFQIIKKRLLREICSQNIRIKNQIYRERYSLFVRNPTTELNQFHTTKC